MANTKKISVLLCFVVIFVGLVNASKKRKEYQAAVGMYELKKGNLTVKLTNWGASIVSLYTPDKHGNLADVALGYDDLEGYMGDRAYLGATTGRVTNRIKDARFSLNGREYKLKSNEWYNILESNERHNTLHGWYKGLSDDCWNVSKHQTEGPAPQIVFTYRSPDGQEGFPGDLQIAVAYKIHKNNSLVITMKARALNKPTPVNLAQNTFWNLGGHNSGNILSNEVQIFGSHYLPVDAHFIPTGKTVTVKDTPYDFLKPHTVGSRIKKLPRGYDVSYVLDGEKGHHKMRKAAIVHDKKSGRVLELSTDAPIVQFYSGNYLKDVKGKGGYVYKPHAGLSLVTQGYPNAVNQPNFPSQIVHPGKTYKHEMMFKFSTKAAH